MKAAILAVLLALFFLGAGAGMATRAAIDHYVTAWWYAGYQGSQIGFVVAVQESEINEIYAGYEFVGVPGAFWGLCDGEHDCP